MRAINDFILEPKDGKLYNTSRYDENSDLVFSTSKENHNYTNRFAKVISVPLSYSGPIEAGHEVIVHHNVFRKRIDVKGNHLFATGLIHGDKYTASEFELFAYKSKDSEWTSISPYVFVKPTGEEEQVGEIMIVNDHLSVLELKTGDKIYYKPGSEYEFVIDGQKMYRVNMKNLCVKFQSE